MWTSTLKEECRDELHKVDPRGLTEEELLAVLKVRCPEEGATVVPDKDWQHLVRHAQRQLLRRLARNAVCVEVNPTSNLLVGGFPNYESLPYQAIVDAGVAMTVNTDDPGIFMTSLPTEFSHMYRAIARQEGHRRAFDWLRDRADDARQFTFLCVHVPGGEDAFKEIAERTK